MSTSKLRNTGAKHIIVDSGSKDETLQNARLHGIEVTYHPPGNMYAAINKAIRDADSKWVTYINGDDILFADSVIDALNRPNGDYDLIYGNIDYVDTEGRFVHHWKSAVPRNLAGLFAMGVMPIPQSGTLFRKSLWEQLGGFDENLKYSSDFDFFLRAYESKARFFYLNKKPIAAFRLHKDQISQNFSDMMRSEVKASLSNSNLSVGFPEKRMAKLYWRLRNVESYLIRYLRYSHLNQKRRFTRTIE